MNAPAGARTARTKIAMVAIICIAPVVVAWLLVTGVLGWRPGASVAHGTVLATPLRLPAVTARGDGGSLHLPDGLGRFTFVYLTTQPCTERCDAVLERLRRVELGTGKQVVNLQRLLLVSGRYAPRSRSLSAPPAGYAATVDAGAWPGLAAALGTEPAAVFIADPAGRLIVRYPPQFDLKGLIDDSKRLLGAAAH
jgi:hypothetical protein